MLVNSFLCKTTLLKDSTVVDSLDAADIMAIREDIKAYVSDEIRKAIAATIDSFKPHGWRKVTHWLREWGLTSAAIAVPVALLTITLTAAYFAVSEIGRNSEFRGKTDQRLSEIEKRLDRIDQKMVALAVTSAASDPALASSQRRAKDALLEAKQQSLNIPPDVIQQTGKRFIEAAQKEQKAWDVALQFMEYRSFLNITYKGPTRPVPLPPLAHWEYVTKSPEGKATPRFSFTPQAGVPSKQAARYDFIGVDKNADLPLGPALVILTGGSALLDGFHIRNAIFQGVEIHYAGGPLILENVIFVNCTFVIENSAPGRRLGEEMLAMASVNFKNAG
jgi:hypothetical protein